jgi:GDP-mannose 6-dehydrogenase
MMDTSLVGVDPIQTKVDLINQGRTPIIGQEIGDIMAANVESGRLRAVVDPAEAIQAADLSFLGVGTPSQLEERGRMQYGPK